MNDLAFWENLHLQESDKGGLRVPFKLFEAACVLQKHRSLTAADLGHKLKTDRKSAALLLKRLEQAGLATSEMATKARVRIYDFKRPE